MSEQSSHRRAVLLTDAAMQTASNFFKFAPIQNWRHEPGPKPGVGIPAQGQGPALLGRNLGQHAGTRPRNSTEPCDKGDSTPHSLLNSSCSTLMAK